jgi:hypothetical protein
MSTEGLGEASVLLLAPQGLRFLTARAFKAFQPIPILASGAGLGEPLVSARTWALALPAAWT